MMATRFGDANANGLSGAPDDEQAWRATPDAYQQRRGKARRETRFYDPASVHQTVDFKLFTQESLDRAQRRRSSRAKRQSQALLDPAKPKAEPDPFLASGQQLPPALVRQLPGDMIGRPIEDIDPYYADQETFVIISRGKELTRFSATKALYLLGPLHPIRRIVLYILVNSVFNLLVILTILINCVLMTFQTSELAEKTELIFTVVYTTEMGLKVLARGFIVDKFTYLRDPWNWLDFTVIIMAYLTIVIEDLGNLSVIRTFRVLRALKTIAIIPGMKTIVGAVIDSVKNLKDVVVLTLFSLSVFSLLGLQIYMGQLTQKCILNGPTNMSDSDWRDWCGDSSHWVAEPDDEIYGAYRLCGNATGAQSCPANHTCISGFGPNPDYGYTNFDTFGWALICSFRLMTQDFWEGLYMQVLKTAGSWHIIFFIVSIFLGSIYLMNLILAIVAMSYNELQRRAEEEEEAAAEDEAAFLESCRLMKLQEQMSELSNGTGSAQASYRPSVEIGLVGQSLLASLCQNGLLGQQVRDKLNQQMILPDPSSQLHHTNSIRSHSLSVNLEDRANQNHIQANQLQSNSNFPTMATSMTELRRKGSVRTIGSESPTGMASPMRSIRHTSTGDASVTSSGHHSRNRLGLLRQHQAQQPNKLSPHHKSNGVLMARADRGSYGTVYQFGRRSPRASTASDRDLQVLKQRAAMIKICNQLSSDRGQAVMSLGASVQSFDNGHPTASNFDSDRSQLVRTFARRPANIPLEPSNCQSLDSPLLNVALGHETKPHEQADSRRLRRFHGASRSDLGASEFRSEAAICQQPVSVHSARRLSCQSDLVEPAEPQSVRSLTPFDCDVDRISPRKQPYGESSAPMMIGKTRFRTKPRAFEGSNRTLHSSCATSKSSSSTAKQLGIDRCLQSGNMHHLSVENFNQFSQPSRSQQLVLLANEQAKLLRPAKQAPQSTSTLSQSETSSRRGIRNRSDSRGHIHPSTMVRSSFARPRRSVANAGASIGLGETRHDNMSSHRRMSRDFIRRASDWSRLSMSTNVDMRRLLRLWSHTNPYQGRPSVGSISNYSQPFGELAYESPAHSIKGASRDNSPRPSSVGSACQAYELMSALSRRQNRYSRSEQAYAMPLDDAMMDEVSVNLRDKSIAYCLSCLDMLCIWECCGAWLKIQRLISLIVFDPFTELFIILCILINTLFMALDSDDADAQMRSIFERGNYFFTATFAVEASMKILALSPKFYFREGWNVFDSIIVGLSLLELGLEGVYGLSVLRSFRLLRVFKLAKSWPTLNLLISIMGKAVGDLGNLTFVLAIIVFIFAVMGMQLFGTKYVDKNFPSGELPRWNFTDFMHSFMIVFRILCAEWIEPMWDCLLVGGWPCIPFFLIAVTVGNLVVLNLFLALLLASFGASNLSSPQADNVDTKKLQEAIARFSRFARWSRRLVSRSIRWLGGFLLGNRAPKSAVSSSFNGAPGNESDRPVKSHIVTMSRLERLKNIELRTEQLKNKIRKSPEHHYHLKQLAKSQVRQATGSKSATIGYNFHYKSRRNLENAGFKGQPGSSGGQPMLMIPIIVNEPADVGGELEPDPDEPSSVALDLSESSCNDNQTPSLSQFDDFDHINETILLNKSTNFHPAMIMQPIKEDSKDLESNGSSSDAEPSIARDPTGHRRPFSCDPQMTNLNEDEETGADEPLMLKDNREVKSECDVNRQLEPVQNSVICPEDDMSLQEESRPRSSMYLSAPKRQEMEENDEKTLQYIESYIERCICIGIICLKWFLFRQQVRKIVEHRYFDQCILLLIVISSGTLAFEDKHLSERPTLRKTLDILDTIFTIIFSLEMIFKWLAFGMKRYFGNLWSWLDFIIVLVSFINLMASIFGSGKIQALKTMRTLRAMRGLRPLRALQRFQGMRVVVNALIQAIPSIFNVLLVCLIFWLIFSIMGVQMFGGKFWRCLNPETRKVVSYEEAANKAECIERNLTWANPQINFDNVSNAYLALFQVATFKGWIDIMNSATDSRMRDDQPIREANIYMYFYFVFFVIFGSFFTLNLFIGVIIDNFNEQKKKTGGSLEIFMTDDQKKYYHAMKKMKSKRPIKAMTRPKMKLQAYMFDITTCKKFDMAIMLIIGLNMFVMALEHYGQSQESSLVLENLNIIFIAIFTLECLCKIFAMRHFYFREPWNVFDFIVVDLSILGVVMKEYVAKYFVSPTLLRVVRVVKVGRVLRLVKGAKGIRTLLFALAMSLPALFNICLLLFLVMFIYAIFGMSFFMNVRHRAGIDETFNFETFSSSIIVLFQMSTSAGWDLVLDPLMDEENDCQKPDPVLGIEGTCGNKGIAIFYLVSYVIVTFLIIINMYIAVILENYSQATEDVQEGLTDDDYEMYYEIWQKFDPDGTQYLTFDKLSDFVDALEDPLRIPKPNELALVVLDINIYEGNRCYCVDILDALTKYFFTRKGLVIQVNEHLQKVQSTLHETPFERITTTYLLKRQNYCAKVIQNCWRKWRQRTRDHIKGEQSE